MPIYEYRCGDCQSEFEQLIRGDEKPVCDSCKSHNVVKQFSVPASARTSSATLPVVPPGGG